MSAMNLPRCQRYPSLDFWRGVACLMVVVFHSSFYVLADHGVHRPIFGLISYLWLGVPFFFVISGYCISSTCDSMRRKPRSVKTYFWRRYRRIFPPFWICSIAAIGAVLAAKAFHSVQVFADSIHPIADPTSLSIAQWIGTFTLTESWRGPLFEGSAHYFLGHAWSLCYEEQFYVVCGVLLFLAPLKFFRNAVLVSVGVGAICIAASIYNLRTGGFFFDGRWFPFAFGILLYWILNYAGANSGRGLKWTLTIAAMVTCPLFFLSSTVRHVLLYDRNLETVAALLFTVTLLHLRSADERIMSSPILAPIKWCGEMCYSLYLVHWPVVKLVSHLLALQGVKSSAGAFTLVFPLCIVASIAAARLFFLSVERRFLNASSFVRNTSSIAPLAPLIIGPGVVAADPRIAAPSR